MNKLLNAKKLLGIRKLMVLAAMALLAACLVPAVAQAATSESQVDAVAADTADATVVKSGNCGDKGDNVTWTLDSDGLLTIKGAGKMADWQLYKYPIAPWYSDSAKVKSVLIEEGVTSIGECAFLDCESLVSVSIPSGVTSIGEFAFCDCWSLASVSIPSGVTSIGNDAFVCCSSLTSASIPASVASIGDDAFHGCKSLKSVTIPEGVTSIGESAFGYCSSLVSVSIPSSVTSIGEEAFAVCEQLGKFTVASANKSYWTDGRSLVSKSGVLVAYANASGSSYSIPSGVTSIGESAFEYCLDLTSVSIPSSVASIGYGAFCGCRSLPSVSIPSSVTSIGIRAFNGCTSLASVSVPASVTSIGDGAFYDLADGAVVEAGSVPVYELLNKNVCGSGVRVAVLLSACKVVLPYDYTTYTGKAKTPAVTVKFGNTVVPADAYTVSYKNNVEVGTATVTVKPAAGGMLSGSAVKKAFQIKPKPEGFVVTKVVAAVNYNGSITKAAYPIKSVAGAKGALEYSKVSGSEYLSVTKTGATAGKTTGKVTVQPKTPVGTYQMVMRITDTGTGFSKDVTVSVKVCRFAPTISVAKRVCAVNRSETEDQVVEPITQVVCVSKPMAYELAGAKSSAGADVASRFKVNATTGAVTVVKGTPKGTYTVYIKILSNETPNYKQNYKTVACKIEVK